jgi:hypothetical protein
MRRLPILLALALVFALLVAPATSVSADTEQPINGRIDLTLYAVPCPADPVPTGPFVTWVGTVVIDGTTYGWADFPTGPPVFEKKFMYFEEYWTIFTLQPNQAPTVALACDPDLVVLDGFNDGWGTPAAGTYRADGTVGPVAHPGPFADVAAGSRMIWRGKVTNLKAGGDEFKATLHIFPIK